MGLEKVEAFRLGFDEFRPLRTGSNDDKALHALEYIATAVGLLAKAQIDQRGVGRGGSED